MQLQQIPEFVFIKSAEHSPGSADPVLIQDLRFQFVSAVPGIGQFLRYGARQQFHFFFRFVTEYPFKFRQAFLGFDPGIVIRQTDACRLKQRGIGFAVFQFVGFLQSGVAQGQRDGAADGTFFDEQTAAQGTQLVI